MIIIDSGVYNMKGDGFIGKFFARGEEWWWLFLRVIAGIIFILHGLSKFGKGTPGTLFLIAGIIEIVGGILIVLGLWTRLVALIAAIEMIVAWFIAHAPRGWDPLTNGGEPALLFLILFIALLLHGGGKYALEHVFHKKEIF